MKIEINKNQQKFLKELVKKTKRSLTDELALAINYWFMSMARRKSK